MTKKSLHITNGDSLTNYLTSLNFEGDTLTWHEMLCEGPTLPNIDSPEFFNKRKSFLKTFYNIELSDYSFDKSLKILDNIGNYKEINLWFEYDLFCHINLIAAISLLYQKDIKKPLYLICSGRIENEKDLKGLAELTPLQLKNQYQNKVQLDQKDIDLAILLWQTYCGKDHNIFKPYITQKSNFKYLTNCLKAHLKRFPNSVTGLNTIEENILKLIKLQKIKSLHHLMGYCLNYQGFYGFGDMQFNRLFDKLKPFYKITKKRIKLSKIGKKVLSKKIKFAVKIDCNITFGGVKQSDFVFDTHQNKLLKSVENVN